MVKELDNMHKSNDQIIILTFLIIVHAVYRGGYDDRRVIIRKFYPNR